MFNDDISGVVFKDQLITTLGSFLLSTHGVRKGNTIPQRMQSLACMLIFVCQKHNLDLSWAEFLDPQYFYDIVDATKQLGGYSMINAEGESVASLKTLSLTGLALEKCATLLKGTGIKVKNDWFVKNGDLFSQLYKLDWWVKLHQFPIKRWQITNSTKCSFYHLQRIYLRFENMYLKAYPMRWRHYVKVLH